MSEELVALLLQWPRAIRICLFPNFAQIEQNCKPGTDFFNSTFMKGFTLVRLTKGIFETILDPTKVRKVLNIRKPSQILSFRRKCRQTADLNRAGTTVRSCCLRPSSILPVLVFAVFFCLCVRTPISMHCYFHRLMMRSRDLQSQ